MIERFIEPSGHKSGHFIVFFSIFFKTFHAGGLGHIAQVHQIMGSSHQWDGGVLGKTARFRTTLVVPVAKTVTHDSIFGTCSQIVCIASHGVIVVHNQRTVTVLVVIHKRQDDECASPFGGIIEKIAEGDILRCGGRHHPVRLLGVYDVLDNLRNKGAQVVVI